MAANNNENSLRKTNNARGFERSTAPFYNTRRPINQLERRLVSTIYRQPQSSFTGRRLPRRNVYAFNSIGTLLRPILVLQSAPHIYLTNPRICSNELFELIHSHRILNFIQTPCGNYTRIFPFQHLDGFNCTIILNLRYNLSENTLYAIFSMFGNVINVDVIRLEFPTYSVFITYDNVSSARNAIVMMNTIITSFL